MCIRDRLRPLLKRQKSITTFYLHTQVNLFYYTLLFAIKSWRPGASTLILLHLIVPAVHHLLPFIPISTWRSRSFRLFLDLIKDRLPTGTKSQIIKFHCLFVEIYVLKSILHGACSVHETNLMDYLLERVRLSTNIICLVVAQPKTLGLCRSRKQPKRFYHYYHS